MTKPELLGTDLNTEQLRARMGQFLLETKEHFILLHSGRGPGKTYTTQKTIIEDCLLNHTEFCLTVPTIKQRDHGALKKWLSKTLGKEYKNYQTKCTTEYFFMRENEDVDWQLIGHCLPLSAAQDEGKTDSSKYNVTWMIWDEAMKLQLELNAGELLLNLFLIAYHTIDRDENRVKAVFIGNNLNKLDPLFSFFGVEIPDLKKAGTIKRTFNKIAWHVPVPPDLKDDPNNVFRKMIEGTRYGEIASGEFNLSYGYLIKEPDDGYLNYCYAIQFEADSFLLIMGQTGIIYVQACGREFALTYAEREFTTILKEATPERPFVPLQLINMLRMALNAGKCKFIDEESLLAGAARFKTGLNITIL